MEELVGLLPVRGIELQWLMRGVLAMGASSSLSPLMEARRGRRREVPGEGIRSCARDKAERGVEGEDRRRGDAWLGANAETANDGRRRGTRRT